MNDSDSQEKQPDIKDILAKMYEVVDKEMKIPPSHLCSKCENLIVDPYECENKCERYCHLHLPTNKKCSLCESNLLEEQKLSEFLKKQYKISCLRCNEQMNLGDWEKHSTEECIQECPENCGEKILFCNLKKHLEEDCSHKMILCAGCGKQDQREAILEHQQNQIACKNFVEMKSQILSLEEKIDALQKSLLNEKKIREKREKREKKEGASKKRKKKKKKILKKKN